MYVYSQAISFFTVLVLNLLPSIAAKNHTNLILSRQASEICRIWNNTLQTVLSIIRHFCYLKYFLNALKWFKYIYFEIISSLKQIRFKDRSVCSEKLGAVRIYYWAKLKAIGSCFERYHGMRSVKHNFYIKHCVTYLKFDKEILFSLHNCALLFVKNKDSNQHNTYVYFVYLLF